jgi:hypothetical protein
MSDRALTKLAITHARLAIRNPLPTITPHRTVRTDFSQEIIKGLLYPQPLFEHLDASLTSHRNAVRDGRCLAGVIECNSQFTDVPAEPIRLITLDHLCQASVWLLAHIIPFTFQEIQVLPPTPTSIFLLAAPSDTSIPPAKLTEMSDQEALSAQTLVKKSSKACSIRNPFLSTPWMLPCLVPAPIRLLPLDHLFHTGLLQVYHNHFHLPASTSQNQMDTSNFLFFSQLDVHEATL